MKESTEIEGCSKVIFNFSGKKKKPREQQSEPNFRTPLSKQKCLWKMKIVLLPTKND